MLAGADRPWSYRLSGVYELPYQVSFSGSWIYQAGAPEETTVEVGNTYSARDAAFVVPTFMSAISAVRYTGAAL